MSQGQVPGSMCFSWARPWSGSLGALRSWALLRSLENLLRPLQGKHQFSHFIDGESEAPENHLLVQHFIARKWWGQI